MKAVKEKIKSNNGATVVMALGYLLLCITIGGIILSAGSAAIGQTRHLRDEEQDYMTVYSAAELIRSEMAGGSFVEEYVTITHDRPCDVFETSPQRSLEPPANALADKLESLYDDPSAQETFLIQAPELGLEDVTVRVSMNAERVLKFVLTRSGETPYALTLTMAADVESLTETDTSVHEFQSPPGSGEYDLCTRVLVREITTVTFDASVITKGEN
ncbi:MAG TPA: hypothetical protein DF480_04430 [Clostridiales bacterium]|nr:hypothetical protein [Clostridiales bacterium]